MLLARNKVRADLPVGFLGAGAVTSRTTLHRKVSAVA